MVIATRVALAVAGVLAVCAIAGTEAAECKAVDPQSPVFEMIVQQTKGLFAGPPAQVLACASIGPAALWKAHWDVYQTSGEWRKRGTADCWDLDGTGTPYCSRTIRVEHADGTSIGMNHEISLERVAEIVEQVRALMPAGDRILEIQYAKVHGGGVWSLREYGYRVTTSNAPYHGSGDVYTLVTDCAPTPCQWQIEKRPGWVS